MQVFWWSARLAAFAGLIGTVGTAGVAGAAGAAGVEGVVNPNPYLVAVGVEGRVLVVDDEAAAHTHVRKVRHVKGDAAPPQHARAHRHRARLRRVHPRAVAEVCASVKRDLFTRQKRPVEIGTPEPNVPQHTVAQEGLAVGMRKCQKRPIYTAKET